MADALAEAVAKAEAELAAEPERIWVTIRTARESNNVLLLGASYNKKKAIELADKNAKAHLVWTPHKDNPVHAATSDYVNILVKKKYADVRYTILRVTVHEP